MSRFFAQIVSGIATLCLWATVAYAVNLEGDASLPTWCGLPEHDPESIGLPVVDIASVDEIQPALDLIECRGTLRFKAGTYTTDDTKFKVRYSKDHACNLKWKGPDDGLAEFSGWVLPRMQDPNYGCYRARNLKMGGDTFRGGGANFNLGTGWTYLSLHRIQYRNRPRIILNAPLQSQLKGARWDNPELLDAYPTDRYVEIVDSEVSHCASAGSGSHHCLYLEVPDGHFFIQNLTVSDAEWTGLRILSRDSWVRNSHFSGQTDSDSDSNAPVQQVACSNSLWEGNTFETGRSLNAPTLMMLISRRSLGGCLDQDPGAYRVPSEAVPMPTDARFKRHILVGNRFIAAPGVLPATKNAAGLTVQGAQPIKALNSYGQDVYVYAGEPYQDPTAVWLSGNTFEGLQRPWLVEQEIVGRNPTPAQLMRCKPVETPPVDEILKAGIATDYIGTMPPECDPWDYVRYPIDRREGVVLGQAYLKDGADIPDPTVIFAKHALLDHWRELAGMANTADVPEQQAPVMDMSGYERVKGATTDFSGPGIVEHFETRHDDPEPIWGSVRQLRQFQGNLAEDDGKAIVFMGRVDIRETDRAGIIWQLHQGGGGKVLFSLWVDFEGETKYLALKWWGNTVYRVRAVDLLDQIADIRIAVSIGAGTAGGINVAIDDSSVFQMGSIETMPNESLHVAYGIYSPDHANRVTWENARLYRPKG